MLGARDAEIEPMEQVIAITDKAKEYLKPFIYINPLVGEILLWESWLRHEVPINMSPEERISISFNYSW